MPDELFDSPEDFLDDMAARVGVFQRIVEYIGIAVVVLTQGWGLYEDIGATFYLGVRVSAGSRIMVGTLRVLGFILLTNLPFYFYRYCITQKN
jgi:hypothetical protein